jgi:hypothetical protein
MDEPAEPTFTVRAQDRFAPAVLEFWADQVERAVKDTISDKADASRRKVALARSKAHMMRAWQAVHYHKIPD